MNRNTRGVPLHSMLSTESRYLIGPLTRHSAGVYSGNPVGRPDDAERIVYHRNIAYAILSTPYVPSHDGRPAERWVRNPNLGRGLYAVPAEAHPSMPESSRVGTNVAQSARSQVPQLPIIQTSEHGPYHEGSIMQGQTGQESRDATAGAQASGRSSLRRSEQRDLDDVSGAQLSRRQPFHSSQSQSHQPHPDMQAEPGAGDSNL